MSSRKSYRQQLFRGPLALDGIFDGIVKKAFDADSPEVLFHYTSWNGAKGILSSQRFWSTAHDCTNDEAELASADSVILEVATELKKNASVAAVETLNRFLAGYSKLRISRLMTVCLACFSLARDDAAQWQEYGDKGSGLCLGLRILKEGGPYPNNGALVKVDYEESSWRETVTKSFREILQVFERLPRGQVSNEAIGMTLNGLYRVAAMAAISAKGPKWSREQECRHVMLVFEKDRGQIKEREKDGKVIRYMPVLVRSEEKRIALSEIIIGPNQQESNPLERLKALLAETGYMPGTPEYPTLTFSSVPRDDS